MVTFTLFSADEPVAGRLIERWGVAADLDVPKRSAERAPGSRLARAALCALLNRLSPAQEWAFCSDSVGKPFVKARFGGEAGPAVSLSHSGKWVACAISGRPVGIDVERHRERRYSAIAEYAFGERERDLVCRDGGAAFYRIWTLREAIAKATGDGLRGVMDRRDRAHGGAEGHWTAPADNGGTWLLAHVRPQPEVSLAIALLAGRGVDWSTETFEEIRPAELC